MRLILMLLALAFASPASADECDVLAARAVSASGARLVEREGDLLTLSHKAATGVLLNCANMSVAVYKGAPIGERIEFVDAEFFDLFARVASAAQIGREPALRAAAIRCQEAMLRSNAQDHSLPEFQHFFCSREPRSGMASFGIVAR